MYQHLHSKQYYEDLYDKLTVEDCLSHRNLFLEKKIDPNDKDFKEKERVWNAALGVSMYFKKGFRYKRRESTIKEWMNRDEEIDKRIENTIIDNIKCPFCLSLNMEIESKDLFQDTILFMYKCGDCKKLSCYDEYRERRNFEIKCPNCSETLKGESKRDKDKITTQHICPNCGYKEKPEVYTLKSEKKEDDSWKNYRPMFCLSEEQGRKFLDEEININNMKRFVDEMKEREENKTVYDKLEKIQKLNIAQLKELLNKTLIKNKYIKLEFLEPEISKDIIVTFKVRDDNSQRDEYTSKTELKRLIDKNLENTNWRLMSDGVNYRLGFISGRLRGYENESDLIKLIK